MAFNYHLFARSYRIFSFLFGILYNTTVWKVAVQKNIYTLTLV